MTDFKKSARKSAKQARKRIEKLEVPSFQFSDVEWNILRQREEKAASQGFLGGFLLGILVGAVLALIFAPRRGEETRQAVVSTATDLKDKATDLVQQVRSDDTVEDVEQTVDEVVEDAKPGE